MKHARAKGRDYYYFDTGQTDEKGKRIWSKMPSPWAKDFATVYSGAMGHRTRRANVPSALTVKRLIHLYETSPHFKSRSPATQRIYSRYLEAFANAFADDAPAAGIIRKDVVLLLDTMSAKPGAANMVLASTSALYAWARGRGHVENDPCRDIEPLELGEHEPWPQEALDAALASTDARVRLSAHLLYYTAQRIGDVAKMRWADITGDRIVVRQQKTGILLDIRLHSDLAAELAKHQRSLTTIIPGVKGKPLSITVIREALQAFCTARGFKVVPHGLRKNAVNALLEAGCSAAEAASISGQSLGMIEHYSKLRAQGKLASAAVLKWEKIHREH
jgi:integrase